MLLNGTGGHILFVKLREEVLPASSEQRLEILKTS